MLFDLFKKRVQPTADKATQSTNRPIQSTFVSSYMTTTPRVYNEIKFLPKEYFLFTRDMDNDYSYYNKFSSSQVEERVRRDFMAEEHRNAKFEELRLDNYSIYIYTFCDGDKDYCGRNIRSWLCVAVNKEFRNTYTLNDFKCEVMDKIESFGSLQFKRWDLANEFIDTDKWKIVISKRLTARNTSKSL